MGVLEWCHQRQGLGGQGPPDTVGWREADGWWGEVERHACPPRAEWADMLSHVGC